MVVIGGGGFGAIIGFGILLSMAVEALEKRVPDFWGPALARDLARERELESAKSKPGPRDRFESVMGKLGAKNLQGLMASFCALFGTALVLGLLTPFIDDFRREPLFLLGIPIGLVGLTALGVYYRHVHMWDGRDFPSDLAPLALLVLIMNFVALGLGRCAERISRIGRAPNPKAPQSGSVSEKVESSGSM